MNVSALQFYVFLGCVSFGFIGGIFFLLFMPLRNFIKFNILKIIIDIFCFSLLTILYIFLSFKFNFPSIRAYMILGVLLGLYIYFETLHIPLAKLLKTVYNIIVKKCKNKKVTNKVAFKG